MMSEVYLKCVTLKIILTVWVLLITVKVDAGGLMDHFGGSNVDVDEMSEAHNKCFWHIMCEMKVPLEIKKVADVVHEKEWQYVIDTYIGYVPEDVRHLLTLENLRDDEIWIQYIQPEYCATTSEFRNEVFQEEGRGYMLHNQENCEHPELQDVCESIMNATIIYNEILAKMIEEEECVIPMYKEQKEMLGLE